MLRCHLLTANCPPFRFRVTRVGGCWKPVVAEDLRRCGVGRYHDLGLPLGPPKRLELKGKA